MNIQKIIDELLLEVSVYHPIPDFRDREHLNTLLNVCEERGYGELIPLIEASFLNEAPDGEQSQAQKMGLVHLGRGYYGKKKGGPASHRSEDGKIVPLKPDNTAGGTASIEKAVDTAKEKDKEDSKDPFIAAAKGETGEAPEEKEKSKEEEEHEAAINTPEKVLNDPKASARSIAVARAQQAKNNTASAGEEENADVMAERPQPEGFDPVQPSDVVEELPKANADAFVGKSELPEKQGTEELEQFNTNIEKLAKIIADAKEKGGNIPNVNLCQVSVPGTNLYCDGNLGIPREEMPQFKGKPIEGSRASKMPLDKSGEVDTEPVFKEMLKQKGIKTIQTEMPADKLKATQSELVAAKVLGMLGALDKDPNHPGITAPIYVSRDGYVVDGHHRWAAVVAYNAKHPNAQIPMRVTVIDGDIKNVIPMANKFAEDIGIAAKKADANKEAPTETKPSTETKQATEKLKSRKDENGESLDVETTDKGSLIIGVEHGEGTESTKQTIETIKSLPKDTKVMFVGEGGMTKDDEGNVELGGEQDEIRNATKEHFTNYAESSWDENANVFDNNSPVFSSVAEKLGGSQSKANASIWSNMVGQGDDMNADDYLDDDGKKWLIDQAKKGGSKQFDGEVDWNNLTDDQRNDLYQLNFRDDDKYGETEISAGQLAYNDFRQKELDKKIKEAESKGYTVIAPVGNSHVDLWRKRNKSTSSTTKPTEEPKVTNDKIGTTAKTNSGKTLYHIGGGYYSDSPNGVAKYIRAESIVERAIETGSKNWWNLLFEADIKASVKDGGEGIFREIPKNQQDAATVAANKVKDTQVKSGKVKKNKELDQTKNTSDEFNVGVLSKDGVSDADFKSNKKIKPTPAQIKKSDVEKFFIDQNGKARFPKKYIKVLTRLLNSKPAGVTISDFTNASGAGTLPSTMGELLTMMVVTIKDDTQSNEFFNILQSHVKTNGKDSIIDVGWVKSAQKVRDSLYKRYDRIYGKGNWELEQMAWDVPSEVESLGLNNYKQNKGFSTDVYAKVKVNGKSILDEISLKKELTANLLNATSNRVQDIMVRGAASEDDLKAYDRLNAKIDSLTGLKDKESVEEKKKLIVQRDAIIDKYNAKVPEDVKVSNAQKRQRELHQSFIKNGENEAVSFLKKFCSKNVKYRKVSATNIKNQLNQKEQYIKDVTKKIDALCKEVKSGKSYGEALIATEKADYQKLNLSIMAAISLENPDSNAAKIYNGIIKNSHNHSKAVRNFLLKDDNARRGLFASIREALPLKALFEGEENMILGDVSADKQVLQDVFKVKTFEELEQKLTIRDTPPPPSIVYRVVGKEDIPVAEISSRPDGIGYGGTWKLEMKVHPEFGKKLKESNSKLNGEVSEGYSKSVKKKILERLKNLIQK